MAVSTVRYLDVATCIKSHAVVKVFSCVKTELRSLIIWRGLRVSVCCLYARLRLRFSASSCQDGVAIPDPGFYARLRLRFSASSCQDGVAIPDPGFSWRGLRVAACFEVASYTFERQQISRLSEDV